MRFFQVKIMLKSTNSYSASRRKRHWSSTVVLEFEKLLMEDKGFYIFSPLQKRARVAANVQGKSKYDWEIQSAWTRAMSSSPQEFCC